MENDALFIQIRVRDAKQELFSPMNDFVFNHSRDYKKNNMVCQIYFLKTPRYKMTACKSEPLPKL